MGTSVVVTRPDLALLRAANKACASAVVESRHDAPTTTTVTNVPLQTQTAQGVIAHVHDEAGPKMPSRETSVVGTVGNVLVRVSASAHNSDPAVEASQLQPIFDKAAVALAKSL